MQPAIERGFRKATRVEPITVARIVMLGGGAVALGVLVNNFLEHKNLERAEMQKLIADQQRTGGINLYPIGDTGILISYRESGLDKMRKTGRNPLADEDYRPTLLREYGGEMGDNIVFDEIKVDGVTIGLLMRKAS